MRVVSRLFLVDDTENKFFGEGPARLLKQVEKTGSLHSAAFELGMAYSKATKLLKNAEKSLGFPLTVRKIGGKSGGGSILTDEAKDFLQRYENYRNECTRQNEKLFEKYFGEEGKQTKSIGCVIMASGLGKRFGGEKLSAELFGKPVIQYIVEATEGLFSYRLVVTRSEKIKAWCEERNIPTVFHALPDRNDTIRLGLMQVEEKCGEALRGCVFCPADMPFVSRDSLKKMLSRADGKTDGIVRVSYQGSSSAPVLFGKDYFSYLKNLPKGKGGSEIVKNYNEKVLLVEAKEEYELWDIDTQEDLIKAKNHIVSLHEGE